mmetsp:Transcript_114864/g.161370  ORF Transcript_114864/g.161370 Transcript_114864/m.161370 type:complete len:98 (-) Transcript_114864:34-327(-)
MSERLITDKELADLKEQLDRMPHDKDRLRLVCTAADSFRFTCDQLKELVEVQHYGEALRTTAINIYPKLEDPDNFDMVLQCYKYEEDREEIREALGL